MAKRGWVFHHDQGGDRRLALEAKPHRACELYWAAVKRFHAEKFGEKWRATTLYSFGLCPHGVRFTGCGWDRNQAANGTDKVGPYDGADSEWFTVLAFIAGPEGASPRLLDGLYDLVGEGRDSGRCGRAVLPHNAFKVKECPGVHLTAVAALWNGRPLPLHPKETSTMQFTEGEATMHVVAAYADVTGREPGPDELRGWVAQLQHDAKNYFRLITLLVKEQRQRHATGHPA